MSELTIGCHLSPSKGLLKMAETAASVHANTFQFFSRNPRGSKAKEINSSDSDAMIQFLKLHHFRPVLVHAPYTLNPSSNDSNTREFAEIAMKDDLSRMQMMNLSFYNLHPGSHVGHGIQCGIQLTAKLLNSIIPDHFPGMILLETMSGQGSEIGSSFNEINQIIQQVDLKEKVGVCLDTCHVFAAGYDIKNDPDKVLTEFDKIIGIDKLKFVHLNDSKFPCGAHKDRHAAIGFGEIGVDGIKRIINHPVFKNLPFCLETPHDSIEEYADEIQLVRTLANVG